MFSLALSCQQYQALLPSLQQTNRVVSGARSGAARHAASRTLCEQSFRETLRKLDCLSPAELSVLSAKCVDNIPAVLSASKNIDLSRPLTLDEWVVKAGEVLKNSDSSVTGGIAKSQFLFPKSKLLTSRASPMIHHSRGFKTKRGNDSPSSAFLKLKENEGSGGKSKAGATKSSADSNQAELLTEILKHIDLPKQEKEKVNIAVMSYAAGFASAKDSGAAGSAATDAKLANALTGKEETKRKFFDWTKVHNFASILVIVAIIISLGQIFNIPILRVSRGGNEIAPEDIEVTFDDVKGCDEAKQELQEVVEFLMNPDKFSSLGGRLPKGCLLVGPPGTGKTLLARAVAGQAGVPFFHASGSEFDEVLVGQGARRVRDLFKAAKARAPCVIFIDEIDSVGSKRTSSVLHPYANQTINQLLSEMDGFVLNEGVIVLGATNRSEDLDKALLRPGRFDTQVMVTNPDIKGRREILNLYLSKIKHDDSVDLEKLAKMTVGFSGADLQNMVNTAAIRAAVENKDYVGMEDFEYSHDKHVLGTDWKSRVREKEDLRITAYHEAGHTLVAYFTPDTSPLHKVTIVAKGQSGGHTAFLPENDAWHVTKAQLLAKLDVSMGGRAAEELVFGKDKVTGGASHDLETATHTAETMVKKLGLSDKMGLRVVRTKKLGPASNEMVDNEVNKILDESYSRAGTILKKYRKQLDLVAEALLNYETLDAEDIKAIIEQKPPAGKIASGSNILSYKTMKHRDTQKPLEKGSQPLGGGPTAVPVPAPH